MMVCGSERSQISYTVVVKFHLELLMIYSNCPFSRVE